MSKAIVKAFDFVENTPRAAPSVHKPNNFTGIDSVIAGICEAASKKYPLVSRKACIVAGQELYKLGKNITVDAVVSLAKSKMSMRNSRLGKGKGLSSSTPGGGVAISGMPATYAPVAVSRSVRRTSKPKMRIRGDAMVVTHSEMLGSILSGAPTANVTAYRCIGYRANPGISTVFPWLSSIAVNYEKYRFRRLTFTIVPLVATNFSGRIGLGFDYDSTDAPPGNRQEFYSLTTHAENMPWEAARIAVKCDSSYKFTGTHVAADNKLVDQGQVIIMSDSISNGATISAAIPLYDLIVDYEVELIEPQQALFASQAFNKATSLVAGVPLGTGVDTTVVSGPSIVSSTTVTSTVLTFVLPAGTYLINYYSTWTSGGATAVLATTTTGTTLNTFASGGTAFAHVIGVASSSSDSTFTVTLAGVSFTSAMLKFNLLVSRVASQLVTNFVP